MDLFIEGGRLAGPILVQPCVAGVAHNCEKPSARISAVEAAKKPEGTQVCLLYHVFRVLLVPRQPACEVVGGVQVRQNGLFKSHTVGLLGHWALIPVVGACRMPRVMNAQNSGVGDWAPASFRMNRFNFSRSAKRARRRRDFTAEMEIPNKLAVSSVERLSTSRN